MLPLAQTFLIDAADHPNGIFVKSIDLFFTSIDGTAASLPVIVKMGPINVRTQNPDFNTVYPFAVSVRYPSNIYSDGTGGTPTNFAFDAPIHLSPGVHYFSIHTNSPNYQLLTAIQGQNELNTGRNISLPPFTGLLYLPSPFTSPIASDNEDLKFIINRCEFSTTPGSAYLTNRFFTGVNSAQQNSLSFVYTTFNIGSDIFDDFGETTVTHLYKKTDASSNTLDASYVAFSPGIDNNVVKSRLNENTLKIKVDLSTTDSKLTPLFDIDRINGIFIDNTINNDTTGETGSSGGSANAKYITKVIELLPSIDADDLVAYALLKLPVNTNVKVYYKAAQPGVDINNVNYVEMSKTPIGTPNTDSFVEYKFTTSTGFALPDQSFFSKFMFKIVMLSSDTQGRVPIVKDFRAIALLDS